MKADDKQMEMNRFVKGETNIMVATTVIEVGVNVPNASIGYRKRRNLAFSTTSTKEELVVDLTNHTVLMTGNKLTKDAKLRMETMTNTNDGFEVAEVDLKPRGVGDLMGTKQWLIRS